MNLTEALEAKLFIDNLEDKDETYLNDLVQEKMLFFFEFEKESILSVGFDAKNARKNAEKKIGKDLSSFKCVRVRN